METPTVATDQFATPEELAKHWRTTPNALARLRYRGVGPEFMKRGRRVLYPWHSIRAYEQRNTHSPEAQTGAA